MITQEYVPFHKVIKLLQDFANRHISINSFGFGNLLEYGKDIEDRDNLYPVLFVVPQNASYDETLTDYSLSVIIADRLSDDLDNRISVISNMSMIAKDLIGEIKLGDLQEYFDVPLPISSNMFIERFMDNVGGVQLTLPIQTIDPLNVCESFLTPTIYQPNGIDNLYAWYDFQDTDTIMLSGGTYITNVLDKSNNFFDLTPLSASPVYSASTYTNSDGYYAMWDTRLGTALGHNTSPKTWTEGTSFVVYTKPSPQSVKSIWGVVSGNTTSTINQAAIGNGVINEDVISWSTISCREVEAYAPYQVNDFAITKTRMGSTTLGDMDGAEYTKYGVLNADINDCLTQPSNITDWIVVGDSRTIISTESINGIMEVIVYDRKLTDDEYNGVLEYLKDKYNYNNWI